VLDRFEVLCPWCGELLELDIAPEDQGTLVQDCGVCCNPCEISIRRDEWGDAQVTVERAQ
jgi:cysteine-rich CPXCG protein